MSRHVVRRFNRPAILVMALVGMMLCAGASWGYWQETQLGGVRLGDSAFVLLEMPGFGNPDAFVVPSSQPEAGPATSESFGSNIAPGEGPGASGSGGGAGGPGMMGGGGMMGPGGPFGSGAAGMMGPGGGSSGGPMSAGPAMMGAEGMARGFFGSSRPGSLNIQTGMGMMGPSSAPSAMGPGGRPGGSAPMPPGASGGSPMAFGAGGMGGMGAGLFGQPGGGGGGLGGASGGGLALGSPGSGVSSFPDWALSVWFDLRENEMEWFYLRDPGHNDDATLVAVGFVINKLDGKIVAISVAGEECDFARTAMWKPHEYVQLGDSFKQVLYRYGWPHDIETFDGTTTGDPMGGLGSVTFSNSSNSFRRDCILWYHEVRGEKQCNIAFTLHDERVTRIHIWIPEPI